MANDNETFFWLSLVHRPPIMVLLQSGADCNKTVFLGVILVVACIIFDGYGGFYYPR